MKRETAPHATWKCFCAYQDIQTPLSEPCRYVRNTAGRWERICNKGGDFNFMVYTEGLAKLTNSFKRLSSGWGVTSSHLFCGPSPTRYSMTLSTAPLSLGRTGLANGGPGGCMPAKTNAQIKSRTKTNAGQPSCSWQEPTYTWHWWAGGPGHHLDRGSDQSGSLRGSSWSWEGNTFCRDSDNGWPDDLLALTFYIHNPVNADIPPLWDWYKVLILLVCVRYLTHRCATWSQWGSGSRSHCNWGSHRHGSQSHPSLSELCIGCIILLRLISFKSFFFF